MSLLQSHIQSEDDKTQRTIERLQRQRNTGEISDEEYEEKYESTMDAFRLRFAQVMD
jgi:uncharacterized membrane protein